MICVWFNRAGLGTLKMPTYCLLVCFYAPTRCNEQAHLCIICHVLQFTRQVRASIHFLQLAGPAADPLQQQMSVIQLAEGLDQAVVVQEQQQGHTATSRAVQFEQAVAASAPHVTYDYFAAGRASDCRTGTPVARLIVGEHLLQHVCVCVSYVFALPCYLCIAVKLL